jgi:hypothetical protein
MRKFFTMLPAWAAALFLLSVPASVPANAVIRIQSDMGGSVIEYIQKYAMIDAADGKFIIDGPCVSACTFITGLVKPENVCVTERAKLGFHSAWYEDKKGNQVYSREGTEIGYRVFPLAVRALLQAHGWDGLTPHPDLVWIEGAELRTIIRPCAPEA